MGESVSLQALRYAGLPSTPGLKMRRLAVLSLALSLCAMGSARADVQEAAASTASSAKGVAHKVEKAVVHGVKAAASGVAHGVGVAASGVERGAHAAGKGIQRGAAATGRAVKHVAHKVGVGSGSSAGSQPAP
jgi:hypothetical protein